MRGYRAADEGARVHLLVRTYKLIEIEFVDQDHCHGVCVMMARLLAGWMCGAQCSVNARHGRLLTLNDCRRAGALRNSGR
jgi:hypothetical protein